MGGGGGTITASFSHVRQEATMNKEPEAGSSQHTGIRFTPPPEQVSSPKS